MFYNDKDDNVIETFTQMLLLPQYMISIRVDVSFEQSKSQTSN